MLERTASVIHPSRDLASDRAFWASALGIEPYFDEPFYVGFRVGELEIGLDPHAAAEGLPHPVVYWEVDDIRAEVDRLVRVGASAGEEIRDVGGLLMTTVTDPTGSRVGLLERSTS